MTERNTLKEIIEVQESTSVDEEERKWCVYCHTNKINGKKYFGITSQKPEERWRNGLGYKENQICFWRAINKYRWSGFIHEVIASELTQQEAIQKEIELIALYKTNCCKYKNPEYGYNMTDGGEGTTGWIPTEETKRNISDALKGKYVGEKNPNYGNHKLAGVNNPNYGKHHSDTTKEKIRQSHLGKKASKETKQKLSEIHLGCKSAKARPVYCIELDEIFWGQQEAKNKYNINRCSVGACCRGLRNSAGKHPVTEEPLHWKYAHDAIMLGYITQQQLDDYLNELKKENDK